MMHHGSKAISKSCRFLKNLYYLSKSLISKLHTGATVFECKLYHHLIYKFFYSIHPGPIISLNEIYLDDQFQNAVHKVKTI